MICGYHEYRMIWNNPIAGEELPCYREWTLFLTRSCLLFYFLFRIRSIYFRNIYRLQMALGV